MNTEFSLVAERALTEVDGVVRLFVHRATGAQVLSVTNRDENKVFGLTLRTPPKNSTGVAHILEHSVLCGSAKYPTKEPFLVLLQSSLQSFLNAFTFPDKTCYPVASANLRDFYNLVDVYIDAVFHPAIGPDVFRQEGWHIEAESVDGPWSYKGVVYNEMKGVYSSPESRLAEECQHALFPDTLYSLDSGGRPSDILDLTYEEFRDFHARYYHPSNSRFFFWGDDPEDKRLEIVAEALAGRRAREVGSSIAMQPAFAAPTKTSVPYAAEPGSKCLFAVNWLTGVRGDLETTLILEMLEHILEGMPGSPLRRALISSGLGEDIVGCGLETDLVQTFYSTGLKGVAREDVEKAEALIFSTLEQLAREGLDPGLVEAAVSTVEFAYRESNFGNFPRGLAAMLQSLATWLYDGDPINSLAWEAPLRGIKERLAAGERVFEDAIQRLFLDNPSRATVILEPDTGLAAKVEAEERERVEKVRASATPAERAEIVRVCEALKKAQETPDTPEALATIPSLGLEDLPAKNQVVERRVREGDRFTSHGNELPTRGIAYATLLLPMPKLPVRLLPALSLFLRALREAGTARHDYTELGALVAAKTGGIGFSTTVATRPDGTERFYLAVTGKAVREKVDDFFDLVEEMLLEPATDREALARRFREMLLEDKARLEHGLVSSGHATVSRRLLSRFSQEGLLAENTGGIAYFDALRDRLDKWDESLPGLFGDLDELRRFLVVGRPGVVACVDDAEGLEHVFARAETTWEKLGAAPAVDGTQCFNLPAPPDAEIFTTPSQINYVAKGCNLAKHGYRHHGSHSVVVRHLSRSYLWERVRVLGGAYGAFCSLDRRKGTFVCSSYRDPNVEETLAAYDGIPAYLAGLDLGREELTRAIVGTIGDLDAYRLPDARGALSLMRWLSGTTEEELQTLREEILGTTLDDFHRFAEVMETAVKEGSVCVVGGAGAAAAATARGWRSRPLL